MNKLARVFALASVAAFIGATGGATATLEYTVSTTAGAGTSGIRDGDARTAQFMKPIGIAADARGNIYVADAAAQRIRLVSPAGDVTTLAGSGAPQFNNTWVTGGYKDGPALQAQFNRPSSVAVGPDGAVYVADTRNHCIRIIKNGIVSTYSGAPDNFGEADGPVAKASYLLPRALEFDAKGDLFVADIAGGIRKISGGTVTTLSLPPKSVARGVLSIAFSGPASDETMFVGTVSEIVAFDRDLKLISRQPVSVGGTLFGMGGVLVTGAVEESQEAGPAFGIAAFDDGHLFFADARNHALRKLDNITQPVEQAIPRLIVDAADRGGGYRDGPFREALFDAPMGLARMPDGSIAVADMGNRRIRKVTVASAGSIPVEASSPSVVLTDKDGPESGAVIAGQDPFPGVPSSYYRIAYLGNSYAFFNTRWADSIPGLIESDLRAHWKALGFPKPPKLICVSPIKDLSGFRGYIDNILSLGVVDAVVLQLNGTNIGESFPPPHTERYDFTAYAQTWKSPTRQFIVDMNTELKHAAIPLVVVVNPTAARVSPLEVPVATEVMGTPDWMYLAFGPPNGDTFEKDMKEAVAGSGVPYIFLFPDFMAAEQSAHRLPLFGTAEGHFSKYGRILAASVIVKSLIHMHFWRKT